MNLARPGAGVLLAVALAACGNNSPAPDASNGPNGSSAPDASNGTAIVPTPAPAAAGSYGVAGWSGANITVALSEKDPAGESWLILIKTADAGWQARNLPGRVDPADVASDGEYVAFAVDDTIFYDDAKGRREMITASKAADLPAGWSAGGLAPLPDGGFVVRGASTLILTDFKNKKLSTASLPAGSVVAAATSAAKKYLVATKDSFAKAGGMDLALWSVGDKATKPVAKGIMEIAPSVTGLAFLRTETGWLLLKDDGTTEVAATVKSGVSAISPDGTTLAVAVCGTGCTVSVGPAAGKLSKVELSPPNVAALSISADGLISILGPTPTTGVQSPYFAVIDAKGRPVEYSLPTVGILKPPAAAPSAAPSPTKAP